MDLAYKAGAPFIGIDDSGGARIQEGVDSLGAYGEIFSRNARLSGVIPQISVVLGPSAGGAVYSPALTDFTFVADNVSKMFITGPQVTKAATGEDVTFEELGGAAIHSARSGVAHFRALDETSCLHMARDLLTYLPSDNQAEAPAAEPLPPAGARTSCSPWCPPRPTRHTTCGTCCIGCWTAAGCWKCTKSLRPTPWSVSVGSTAAAAASWPISRGCWRAVWTSTCRTKSPGSSASATPSACPLSRLSTCRISARRVQEHRGIIRHGAKFVRVRGGHRAENRGHIAQSVRRGVCGHEQPRHRVDLAFAWPTAEIAVMGPEGAAQILYRNELAHADDPTELLNDAPRSTASGSPTRTSPRPGG